MSDPSILAADAPLPAARWLDAAEMATAPRGWYWAAFPGAWEFYSPELGKTQGLFHGDTLWHELMSKTYWGPWSPPPEPGAVGNQGNAPEAPGPAPRERLLCSAAVSKRDTYRRTGRGKSGFEMHYVDKRCASPACAGAKLCAQHGAMERRGRVVRLWQYA